MKVLLIDDHNMLRESLVLALKKECPDFDFLQASTGDEAKEILVKNDDCRMIVLDLQVGKENGLFILSELRAVRPEIKTLVCSAFSEPLTVENAISAKVQGYITKTSDLSEIALAVKMVASGKEYFCTEALNVMKANVNASKIASGLLDSPDRTTRLFASYKKLSPKEKEIFGLLAQGFSVSEIAQKLGKSIKTIENQRTAVYEKMELHGMGDLAEGARMLGYY